MDKIIKAASIQMVSELGNSIINFEKAKKFIIEAKEQGAEIVVLPELFDVGYNLNLLHNLQYDSNYIISQLSKLAKEEDIYIAGGILENIESKKYNSVFIFDNTGEVVAKYRKINLFCLSEEKQLFTPGNELVTFSMKGLKLGIMICYDIRFPELARAYVDSGCSAILVSSAFPFPRLDHWKTLLKARAIENQIYIVASNRSGKDGEFCFLGRSCIIDPWGTVKATINETDESVIISEISLNKVEEVRKFIPCLEDKVTLNLILDKNK